ncbi:MAG: tetrahydrofolate dehydrogenase/cyclohydrolase catalytic domain-containing protein [Candidatus Saccharibacteria bacterium]
MPVIDGKAISQAIREDLQKRVLELGKLPVLDIVLAGNDPESQHYVDLKKRAVEGIGGRCNVHHISNPTTEMVEALIQRLSDDTGVHGILVQLPLPDGLDKNRIMSAVKPTKDVDGLHPLNLGLSLTGDQYFTGCGARAVLHVTREYIKHDPPRILVVGDSEDLVKSLSAVVLGLGWPITVLDSWQWWIAANAYDVIVLEKGDPLSFFGQQFARWSLVVDAGFHWKDNNTVGNAAADSFKAEEAAWLLPVPGGLGPLLITMLLSNLLYAVSLNEG